MRIGSYGHVADKSRTKWTIYHNTRCSKSRDALHILRENGIEPEIVEYLVTPLKKDELKELLTVLKVEPKELVRTKEKVFETLSVDLNNVEEVINALAKHPELMERPVVVHGGKGVIARPADKVRDLL